MSLTSKIQNANENCSTYLVLSLLIIIENRVTPILVPWGMSPGCVSTQTRYYLYTQLGFYWSEKTDFIQ